MQQNEPDDSVVRTAITNALSTIETNIRPNKLRKVICKKVQGTNWTQYQRVLDKMIQEEQSLQTTMINDELTICPMNDSSKIKEKIVEEERKTSSQRTNMNVPLAIVYHLIKKGQKKQKRLELNSKTKFTFTSESLSSVKKKDFDVNEETSFVIESQGDNADKELAKKHIKTAKLHVSKMVKAFQVNPHRFCPRKAGGTIKEQQEAKKMRKEAGQKKKKKIRDDEGKDQIEISSKKKRRKFY